MVYLIFNSDISDSVQEELDKLLSGDNDKKMFVKALSKIFTLLLNTRVDTSEKIKRIIKIAIETTLKLWQEPKQPCGAYLPWQEVTFDKGQSYHSK